MADEDQAAVARKRAKRNLDWALKSQEARRVAAMIKLAQSEPGIAVVPADLDRDPWLFNCPNGTIELRTGKLREHRRTDLITKICTTPFHPDAPAPTWQSFLDKVFNHENDVIAYLQRLLGYCITGDVREQQLPILWGSGSNGKSTLIGAALDTIGSDYAGQVAPDLLITPRGDRHLTELADLHGKRLCVASETGEGRPMNEERIKLLTGGDEIAARRMREDIWRFKPTHKIILQTNHRPVVRGGDFAIWRRIALVPFTVRFWDPTKPDEVALGLPDELRKDTSMPERLKAERPGILAWMMRGCLEWQRIGLCPPRCVTDATAEYRSGEDVVGRWLEECCVVMNQTRVKIKAGDAYPAFARWQELTGETPWNQRTFAERMATRFPAYTPSQGPPPANGQYKQVVHGTQWYFGLMLRAVDHDEEG
jgi:putative DNA primase/helicase